MKYRRPLVLEMIRSWFPMSGRVTRFKKVGAVYARVDKNRIGRSRNFGSRDGAAPSTDERAFE